MTTRQKTLRRLIAAATACLMLALSADLALAQSQAEKTGTGQPLRKLTAGATSGQGPAVAAAGGLTVGTVAAAVGVDCRRFRHRRHRRQRGGQLDPIISAAPRAVRRLFERRRVHQEMNPDAGGVAESDRPCPFEMG